MNGKFRHCVILAAVLCLAASTYASASSGLLDLQQGSFDVRLANGKSASAVISKHGIKLTFRDKTVDVLRIGDSAMVQTHDRFGLSTYMPDLRVLDTSLSGAQALNVEDTLFELDNRVAIVQPMGRNLIAGKFQSDGFSINLEQTGVISIEASCTGESIAYVTAAMGAALACATPGVNLAFCAVAVGAFIAAQEQWLACMKYVVYTEK